MNSVWLAGWLGLCLIVGSGSAMAAPGANLLVHQQLREYQLGALCQDILTKRPADALSPESPLVYASDNATLAKCRYIQDLVDRECVDAGSAACPHYKDWLIRTGLRLDLPTPAFQVLVDRMAKMRLSGR